MRIEVKDLRYSYGGAKKRKTEKYALDGVSLTIVEGEFFGIIGQTGSGKSTFVQHLNGLIPLKEGMGEIKVGNYDLSDKRVNLKELRSKVGTVFQYPEYQLFAETVEEDVAFGVKNFFPEKSAEEIKDVVKTAIELVGLDYPALKDKSPFELSGGQKRRVAIAGVIASRPEVLVLDEPAAGLDPQGKKDFLELLVRLHKDFVRTVVIVSHDMNLVAEYCDGAAVFKDGKIIKRGTTEEVFADRECIFKSGLDLPVVEYLKEKLAEKGEKIACGTKISEFLDAVTQRWGGKT